MKLELPKGTEDLAPEQKILQNELLNILTETFELYGFSPLETPILERFDILSAKYAGGEEILNETFKLIDQGKRKLALRYDLTVPFSRFIGMNPTVKMPFKRYATGPVFRDGPIKLGRSRQFWQCDVDIVGSKNMLAEVELLNLAVDAFKKLKLSVEIELNSRKILDAILTYAKVDEKKKIPAILSIDKLKKVGLQGVTKELKEKGLTDAQINKITKIIKIKGSNKEILQELEKVLGPNEGIEELKQITKLTSEKFIKVTPSLARGLAYYTGPVFEVFLKNSTFTSAIAAGGRYDKMIQEYLGSKEEYPAVGISFGLSAIATNIERKSRKTVSEIYIIPIKTQKESIKIAQQLRENNIKTEIDLNEKGISKNLDYANKLEIPYVLFIGQQELSNNKLTLRNMNTGEEFKLPVEKVIEKLKN